VLVVRAACKRAEASGALAARQRGATVLPLGASIYPRSSAAEFGEAVERDLARADLLVQFLSSNPGLPLPGSSEKPPAQQSDWRDSSPATGRGCGSSNAVEGDQPREPGRLGDPPRTPPTRHCCEA
jgi:hypothetical protein